MNDDALNKNALIALMNGEPVPQRPQPTVMRAATTKERVTDKIREFYEWMAKQPLLRMSDTVGATDFGGVAKELDAPRGGLKLGQMPDGPSGIKGAVQKGIKAYHGSPHDFDKFSMEKIGTGEGGQAQGRGLYFSERPEVAQTYRDKLAPDSGRVYEVDIDADPSDFLDWDAPLAQQNQRITAPIIDYLRSRPLAPQFAEKLERGTLNGREVYLVLSGELSLDAARKTWPKMPGRPDAIATQHLKDQGVPGIKYHDAGSRTARGEFSSKDSAGADLTRNYVVFDDKLISIVKKYGVIGALGAGLISQIQAQQLKEQGYQ